jgi:hypothetical protein
MHPFGFARRRYAATFRTCLAMNATMSLRKRAPHLLVALALPCFPATGCAILGPASINNGRSAYNEAIVTTNNEQVLAMIVRMRYGEPNGLLAVSSVTANLHIQSRVGSEFGIGSDSSFEGHLTPLSAGIAYEENPTISYAPVQGEKYLRQFLSPLPIDLTVLLFGALGNSPQVMTLLCRSINGVQNPDFLVDPSVEADPRFARIVALLAELNRSGHTAWAQEPGEPASFSLALSGDGTTYEQRLDELYGLLGLGAPRDPSAVITLPVRLGFGRPSTPAIQLRTRSLYELFGIAAAAVEVPDEHVQSGLAPRLPPVGAVGQAIRIRGSSWRPRGAMIAVDHHGWWYSIDGADAGSKLTFRILEALMSVRMAESVERSSAPILTVPVSR